MKRFLILLPLILSCAPGLVKTHPTFVFASSSSPQAASSLPTQIDLNDVGESDVRNYYSSLNALSESERTGEALLKNLRPILQDFTYYSYDAIWKIYEITDREWALSPASEDVYGGYDASSNTYASYQYSSSNSSTKNNPYVHTLYRNRDENGVTVSEGRIREWGDHSQQGGTNREHVWCQSRGFKASSGASGPAGTDLHHLLSGDGYVNGKPHNNNPYGYVDKAFISIDAKDAYAYCEGNYSGKPKNAHAEDQSTTVFEPQDSDKGDIARACFYMVACYNNLSGNEEITAFNPNLTLVDYATPNGEREDSTASHPVAMGILSDLLQWHKLDPVDDYEIHRNNLIYRNYQHNRNPFVDYPDWVDLIWGESKGNKSAAPSTDPVRLYGASAPKAEPTSLTWTKKPTKTSYTVNDPFQPSGSVITANYDDNTTVDVTSRCQFTYDFSSVGEKEVTASFEGKSVSITVTVNEKPQPNYLLYGVIGGVALILTIILIIVFSRLPKKKRKAIVNTAKKGIKSSTKSRSSTKPQSRKKK